MGSRLLVTMVLTAVVAAFPSYGGASGARVVTEDYVSNGFFVGGHGNVVGQNHHMTIPEESEAVVFSPRTGDRYVELEIEDSSGRPTVVLVHQDAPGGHHSEDLEFCASKRYVELRSSAPLEIRLFSGVCHNHRYGIATMGQITATFAR